MAQTPLPIDLQQWDSVTERRRALEKALILLGRSQRGVTIPFMMRIYKCQNRTIIMAMQRIVDRHPAYVQWVRYGIGNKPYYLKMAGEIDQEPIPAFCEICYEKLSLADDESIDENLENEEW